MKHLSLLIIAFALIIACGKSEKEIENEANSEFAKKIEEVQNLLDEGKYIAAVSQLNRAGQLKEMDRKIMHATYGRILETLREQEGVEEQLATAHLGYGIWLVYYGVDLTDQNSMKEIMPMALRHFRRVLELDPSSDKAQSEIAQLEGIYRSLGREVPQGVAE